MIRKQSSEASSQKRSRLERKALILRRHAIRMIGQAQSGHPGGSLSAADIVAVLYFEKLRFDAKNPGWPDRDRFVLSKGHACPILYAALAETGFFDTDELLTLRTLGGRLEGHPDMKKLPGIEISAGSLGQGLAAANGMALAARLDERSSRIYVLLGDGECQEGEVWEAAMFGAHHRLDNVTAIVDYNNLQIDGFVSDILEIQPLQEKWESFGWSAKEVDGHDVIALSEAIDEAATVKGKPSVIIARTTKCKGISFMENKAEYHGKPPTQDELAKAMVELSCVEMIEPDDKEGC